MLPGGKEWEENFKNNCKWRGEKNDNNVDFSESRIRLKSRLCLLISLVFITIV